MNAKKIIILISSSLMFAGCAVGPTYQRPTIPVPASYKEASNHKWSRVQTADTFNHGQWWKTFHSKQLNALETQVNISNQNIAAAAAQYQQALALVSEARASYFPTITASASVIPQVNGASSPTNSSTSTVSQIGLNGSWEADLWGGIRRNVEASRAGAQMSQAQLAATTLSMQTSLAQYYFELRGVDSDKQLLHNTVVADQRILALTQNLFHNGVDSMVDVVQAKSQLETAQASEINLGVTRTQYEHAIAVLIGKAPADFSFSFKPFYGEPPTIPPQMPSQLLERRPDIAQAERAVAQANAQIGVAIAAYFPALMIEPSFAMQSVDGWFDSPLYSWSIGPALAQTLFEGGLRNATTAAARANYNATVAQYRQTVLAAFQNVEDNLSALRVLKTQAIVQNQAALDAELALTLTLNQYKFGTASYPNVLTAQINAYTAEKTAVDTTTLRMTTTVALISALGGGWNANLLNNSLKSN